MDTNNRLPRLTANTTEAFALLISMMEARGWKYEHMNEDGSLVYSNRDGLSIALGLD